MSTADATGGYAAFARDATGEGLTHLASSAANNSYARPYDPSLLETFANRHPGRDYAVTLRAGEFTTLCPITGQPDFGEIVIRYIPAMRLVESKSLKLYLGSFRNQGSFHEDVVNTICTDLAAAMSPKYLEVEGLFAPRGGIAIHPLATWAAPGAGFEERAASRLLETD